MTRAGHKHLWRRNDCYSENANVQQNSLSSVMWHTALRDSHYVSLDRETPRTISSLSSHPRYGDRLAPMLSEGHTHHSTHQIYTPEFQHSKRWICVLDLCDSLTCSYCALQGALERDPALCKVCGTRTSIRTHLSVHSINQHMFRGFCFGRCPLPGVAPRYLSLVVLLIPVTGGRGSQANLG